MAEVCPLSRGMMLAVDKPQSLSAPLQNSLRFLRLPLPAVPSARLAATYPAFSRENYGLTVFILSDRDGLGRSLSTGGIACP
jgi:hypothetical protein